MQSKRGNGCYLQREPPRWWLDHQKWLSEWDEEGQRNLWEKLSMKFDPSMWYEVKNMFAFSFWRNVWINNSDRTFKKFDVNSSFQFPFQRKFSHKFQQNSNLVTNHLSNHTKSLVCLRNQFVNRNIKTKLDQIFIRHNRCVISLDTVFGLNSQFLKFWSLTNTLLLPAK
jgi:hypothetical protein